MSQGLSSTPIVGPEDEPDLEVNGNPDSMLGDDEEEGFDESPVENGWPDDDEDEDDEDEC